MFKDLHLSEYILKAIEEAGYLEPTLIQQKAIPLILEGKDLLASSQTGTGKTAAFILPTLQKFTTAPKGKGARVLILVPTRELASQVFQETVKYSRHLRPFRAICLFGGIPFHKQNRDLQKPYDLIIATPGRLSDQIQRGRIRLDKIELFILDEADRMLDLNFFDAVTEIKEKLPKNHQTLMFSATLKGPILNLSKKLLNSPVTLDVIEKVEDPKIEEHLHRVESLQHKHRLLDELLNDPSLNQAIIFTSTKAFAKKLVEKLQDDGHLADALHGDMTQRERTSTIKSLRLAKIRILVATDVAARGIDVPAISHVINFDLPNNPEDYVHRIGRTGRAGAQGIATSFASQKDMPLIRRIEAFRGKKIAFKNESRHQKNSEFRTQNSELKTKPKGNFKNKLEATSDRGPFKKRSPFAKQKPTHPNGHRHRKVRGQKPEFRSKKIHTSS